MMPPAMSKTPMEILLNPEAKIPVPNFLVTENMRTPAAIAANAAINEPACMAIVRSGTKITMKRLNRSF